MGVKKPKETETEYFARMEADKKKKREEEKQKEEKQLEKERLKQLHWMRCPKCGMELKEIVFKNARIDKCSGCNGVWLDTGELEMLAGKEGGIIKNIIAFFAQNSSEDKG